MPRPKFYCSTCTTGIVGPLPILATINPGVVNGTKYQRQHTVHFCSEGCISQYFAPVKMIGPYSDFECGKWQPMKGAAQRVSKISNEHLTALIPFCLRIMNQSPCPTATIAVESCGTCEACLIRDNLWDWFKAFKFEAEQRELPAANLY